MTLEPRKILEHLAGILRTNVEAPEQCQAVFGSQLEEGRSRFTATKLRREEVGH